MGRKNKYYRKDLHQQAYSELTGMQAFGESKKQAILDGTAKDKIFSHASYKTYWKHVKYYIKWINASHPDCKTLRAAKKYVNDWLKERTEQTDEEGRHLSAWTIQTEAAALNKLYHIDKADPERFQPPKRKRSEIKRSRTSTARDKHFSVTNNEELINFCIGTGCRRNVLERLEGRDLWPRVAMEKEVSVLKSKKHLSEKELKLLTTLDDALNIFPDQDFFIHHRNSACKLEEDNRSLQAAISKYEEDLQTERSLNRNLLRISKERANAARGISPKKAHDGYIVIRSASWREFCPDGTVFTSYRTLLQTPYDASIDELTIKPKIFEELTGSILADLGCSRYSSDAGGEGSYFTSENGNMLYRFTIAADYRSGFWSTTLYTTAPVIVAPERRASFYYNRRKHQKVHK